MKNAPSTPELKWQELSLNTLPHGPGVSNELAAQASQVLMGRAIPAAWKDVDYRQAAMEAEVEHAIAWQVRVNREERGWKQSNLANRMNTGQSAVSRLEDPAGGDVRVSTLLKAAHAFDCALLVRFVPYSEFAAVTADVRSDRLLACGFNDEQSQTRITSSYGH